MGLEVIFGVLCLLGAGCSKKPPEVLAPVVQPVTTFFIESVSEVPFRRFPGEVMAGRTGRLSFDVPGRLVEFPIFEGQLVKEGDLIGQLERADFIARRDSALAQFTSSIQGVVTDAAGAAVPEAVVRVTNVASGVGRAAVT